MCYKNWYLSSSVVQNSMPRQNSSKFIHEQFHLLQVCIQDRVCVCTRVHHNLYYLAPSAANPVT